MNKENLIARVAGITESSKADAEKNVNAVISAIVEGLEDDGLVDIFKTFKLEVKETKARKARNPQSGEEVDVPAGKRIAFKPLKLLKAVVGK